MVNRRKESKAMVACVIILVLSTLVFMIVAWGAGKRNKPETVPTPTYETEEKPLETEKPMPEESEEKEPGKNEETTKKDTVAETMPEEVVPTVVTVDDIDFTLPAEGAVIVSCSTDSPVYSLTMNDYRTHNGVDISASVGENVYSCASGVVKNVYEDPMMGMTVVISHADGVETVYRNLALEIPAGVGVGASVAAGQVIGTVGETALVECEEESHLHFELVVNGEYVDPLEYIEIASISDTFED